MNIRIVHVLIVSKENKNNKKKSIEKLLHRFEISVWHMNPIFLIIQLDEY